MNKKVLSFALSLLGLFSLTASSAFAAQRLSLTLDGKLAFHSTSDLYTDFGTTGYGGSFLLEWSPDDFFSLGAGVDGELFYQGHLTHLRSYVTNAIITARVYPWLQNSIAPYLMIGGGLGPLVTYKDKDWKGNDQLLTGIGVQAYLNPKLALDLGGRFNLYGPDNLDTVDFVAGFSYFFGNTPAAPKAAVQPVTRVVPKPTPAPAATPAPAQQAQASDAQEQEYEVSKGDTLWDIAKRSNVYGQNTEWPLLYWANKDTIKNPNSIEPHQMLKIKRDYSPEDVEKAIEDAINAPEFPSTKDVDTEQ
jgi:LysM domain